VILEFSVKFNETGPFYGLQCVPYDQCKLFVALAATYASKN